jgi:uncharacterized membrane-anchored protein YitT (DUF2179 family)
MEQGRRPDQMEFSSKASFYCILAAFVLAIIFSFVQPALKKGFPEMSMIIKNR